MQVAIRARERKIKMGMGLNFIRIIYGLLLIFGVSKYGILGSGSGRIGAKGLKFWSGMQGYLW